MERFKNKAVTHTEAHHIHNRVDTHHKPKMLYAKIIHQRGFVKSYGQLFFCTYLELLSITLFANAFYIGCAPGLYVSLLIRMESRQRKKK